MKKIKTVFAVDRERDFATSVPNPGCEWVLGGEGSASVKIDGTSCLVAGGRLFKRYDAKNGKPLPAGAVPCEEAPDPVTGHWPCWVPVGDAPEDKFHREAFARKEGWEDGTYELVGPKISSTTHRMSSKGRFERCGSVKNRYGLDGHELWPHGADVRDVPRTWEGIRDWLAAHEVEGLVFRHPDGRMAKIRRKDFHLAW
jgi:hypothetical protein